MAEETLFQKILSGEVPGNFIGRGENWGAFLDVFPRSQGHTLVVPERPVQRIIDLSKSELSDLWTGVAEVQSKLTAYFKTTDFTVVVHDGPLAGQEIPHVHVHVIPRLEGDLGKALPAMFPNSRPQNPPDFEGLAKLCDDIQGASK
ncbi:MAG: HIT family protein [Candidatus Poseidoniales archaeon]|nr:MAG: HIT family protein [Candidatus Poseidoniales archaeon]